MTERTKTTRTTTKKTATPATPTKLRGGSGRGRALPGGSALPGGRGHSTSPVGGRRSLLCALAAAASLTLLPGLPGSPALPGLPGVGGVGASTAAAQEASDDLRRLPLDEAVALARQNNPEYRRMGARIDAAEWAVREAYGAFLPGASTSVGFQYLGAGNQRIGVFTGNELGGTSTDYYLSDYSLGLSYRLSGSDVYRLSSSRAERRAAGAELEAAGYDLEAAITERYLAALRAREAVDVARRQLDRADENLELVRARFDAGVVPGTDVRQAEVERGRAEVARIRAENLRRAERMRLFEEMGWEARGPVELVDDFEVFEPAFDPEALVARALDAHPRLHASRESERAERARVREARSSYLPTISARVGWSGFARQLGNTDVLLDQAQRSAASRRESCRLFNQISSGLPEPLEGYPQDCGRYALSDSDEARLLRSNDVFPFDFEQQPISASVRISLPIFQGMRRQREVEEAEVRARTAAESRREEELRMRTQVVTAHGNIEAAHHVVRIEERNRNLARERLELARQRYALGAASFLELLDAQSSLAAAERDHLNAVYDFHGALADLERASGLDLSPDAESR